MFCTKLQHAFSMLRVFNLFYTTIGALASVFVPELSHDYHHIQLLHLTRISLPSCDSTLKLGQFCIKADVLQDL